MPSGSQHLARLDTLRACAVMLVLGYHLAPSAIPFGYLGVDVFFVLSGFLMTWLIIRPGTSGGYTSARDFINRRFWRIYPSLLITIFATVLVSAALLSPQHLVQTAQSAIAATTSISNWHFFFEAGYFDVSSSLKPLLHTWSLGVEVQFYTLFAAGLAFTTPTVMKRVILYGLIASILLWLYVVLANTITLNDIFPRLHSEPFSALFFLPQYRLFQFTMGGLAAIILLNRRKQLPVFSGPFGLILSALGLALAGREGFGHWGGAVLSIGIAIVAMQSKFLDDMAAYVPIQYIAKLSYQIYLVHWPIVALASYILLDELTIGQTLFCAACSIIFADILHRSTQYMGQERR
ncbi:MAG: acyltransferase family protein [Alphaproteobacteria bacterium]